MFCTEEEFSFYDYFIEAEKKDIKVNDVFIGATSYSIEPPITSNSLYVFIGGMSGVEVLNLTDRKIESMYDILPKVYILEKRKYNRYVD